MNFEVDVTVSVTVRNASSRGVFSSHGSELAGAVMSHTLRRRVCGPGERYIYLDVEAGAAEATAKLLTSIEATHGRASRPHS